MVKIKLHEEQVKVSIDSWDTSGKFHSLHLCDCVRWIEDCVSIPKRSV